MEWRCEWCGKPHESDDPPCDNCGHGKFEKAVVRQGPSSTESQNSTTVWVCTDCGREHPKNSPPCSRCTNAKLERKKKVVTDADLTARPGDDNFGTTPSDQTMTVWSCADCGREHPKNSPPCSRCGGMKLEKETKTVEAGGLGSTGYLDVLTPAYAVALGAVLLLGVAFVLGATGMANIPFFPDDSVPEVENVPGNESTAANGMDLADVEAAYFDIVNEQREDSDLGPVERDDRLDDIAQFHNQQLVKADIEDDNSLVDEGKVDELLFEDCRGINHRDDTTTMEDGDSAADLGDELFPALLHLHSTDQHSDDFTYDSVGIDAHAVGDELYLVEVVCSS